MITVGGHRKEHLLSALKKHAFAKMYVQKEANSTLFKIQNSAYLIENFTHIIYIPK